VQILHTVIVKSDESERLVTITLFLKEIFMIMHNFFIVMSSRAIFISRWCGFLSPQSAYSSCRMIFIVTCVTFYYLLELISVH